MSTLPGIGIFGTSESVYTLVPALRDKGFRVEAIWGRRKADAEVLAAKLTIPFFSSQIDDVVLHKNVDLIIILTPPNLHAQISVKALRIGKHVVCDRPGGLNQTESLRMVRAAAYYPTLLAMLAYSLRFLPNMSLLKRLLKENYIGEITLCDIRIMCGSMLEQNYSWLCDSRMGGGALSLLGSNIIDLLSFLGLGRALRVHANLRTLLPSTLNIGGIRQVHSDDLSILQLQLVGGTLATVVINTNISGFQQEVVVCGTDGHLVAHGGDLRGRRGKEDRDEVLYIDVEDLNTSHSFSSLLPRIHMKGHLRMVSYLRDKFTPQQAGHDCSGGVQPALFDQGLYIQSVIEALKRSNETRQWVKVVTNEEESLDSGESSWSSFT